MSGSEAIASGTSETSGAPGTSDAPAEPERRSREQRTSDSRARILDAAVACLVESGYAGTTTLTIQARAGVSRGRLLHHFPSKETLLVAAAQHLATSRLDTDGLSGVELPDPETDPGGHLDRAVEVMWSTYQQPYFWASIELWTAARTDPALGAALLPAERRLGAAIRRTVDDIFARYVGTEHYVAVRETLLTSMRGVALTYAFDPRDPATDPHVARWQSLARALLGL